MQKKKLGLPAWIFIAMVAGILVGLCFLGSPDLTTQYIKPIGTIFINLLKFIVVPIVLLSLICGMISMKDIKKVGSIGWKTLVYYMVTTLVAKDTATGHNPVAAIYCAEGYFQKRNG